MKPTEALLANVSIIFLLCGMQWNGGAIVAWTPGSRTWTGYRYLAHLACRLRSLSKEILKKVLCIVFCSG